MTPSDGNGTLLGQEWKQKKKVHVEVILHPQSVVEYTQVQAHVEQFLLNSVSIFSPGPMNFSQEQFLSQNVVRISIVDIEEEDVETEEQEEDDDEEQVSMDTSPSNAQEEGKTIGIPVWKAQLLIHVFKLSEEPPAVETTEDDEQVSTCQQTILPSVMYDGLWESLVYDTHIKRNVLEYATTAMLFSDSKVNPHIITWNRVVLLHGPPGTGKTSLCKALAQKLSIRLATRYPNAHLLEINAHSLFSKWFSESGKLVMKLFRQIQDLVEEEDSLVCVLIDEVESLTAARKAAVNGSEPSDAIRVVNALLTQLDQLKKFPNVLILTTSNITEAIDIAFVDRADIKQYIGPPSAQARYDILKSCVDELVRVGIILAPPSPLPTQSQSDSRDAGFSMLKYIELKRQAPSGVLVSKGGGPSKKRPLADDSTRENPKDDLLALAIGLYLVAQATEGFSGRALRKLPFQAHAFFVQTRSISVGTFLKNLLQTVHMESQNNNSLTKY